MAEPLGRRFGGLTLIAAPLYVAAHTRSPLIVSATTGVAWLPWLLFALPGGVLVDRVDRRRLMIAINWVRAAAMGILADRAAGAARRASPCWTACCSSSMRARWCSAPRARR